MYGQTPLLSICLDSLQSTKQSLHVLAVLIGQCNTLAAVDILDCASVAPERDYFDSFLVVVETCQNERFKVGRREHSDINVAGCIKKTLWRVLSFPNPPTDGVQVAFVRALS
jgi:hypothetical protein